MPVFISDRGNVPGPWSFESTEEIDPKVSRADLEINTGQQLLKHQFACIPYSRCQENLTVWTWTVTVPAGLSTGELSCSPV